MLIFTHTHFYACGLSIHIISCLHTRLYSPIFIDACGLSTHNPLCLHIFISIHTTHWFISACRFFHLFSWVFLWWWYGHSVCVYLPLERWSLSLSLSLSLLVSSALLFNQFPYCHCCESKQASNMNFDEWNIYHLCKQLSVCDWMSLSWLNC